MSEKSEILACVLIPVVDSTLLLPNVSVAEIIDYAEPDPVEDAPAWLLGTLPWRGLALPVVSYDQANGGEPLPDNSRRRIAVLNTIGSAHDKLPFVAIVTQGIPRQAKLDEAALAAADEPGGPADLMTVEFEGAAVHIPNLEYLEQLAAEYAAA